MQSATGVPGPGRDGADGQEKSPARSCSGFVPGKKKARHWMPGLESLGEDA
jgi:hypothetical protein